MIGAFEYRLTGFIVMSKVVVDKSISNIENPNIKGIKLRIGVIFILSKVCTFNEPNIQAVYMLPPCLTQ